mmetsp:Transcript_34068/g.42072  ORF Transcript_34068/g.42072 Transcript_34068/m.42072 type:complete len:285 (+) Transcript_34068:268-1122(+)
MKTKDELSSWENFKLGCMYLVANHFAFLDWQSRKEEERDIVNVALKSAKHWVEPWAIFTSDPANQDRVVDFIGDNLAKFEMEVNWPMILAFPLSVISTNRILNTPISRRGTANSLNPMHLWHDALALVKIGGSKSLLAGLVPTLIYYFLSSPPKDNPQVTRAQRVLASKFGHEKTSETWHDMEVFDRTDGKKAESDCLPWTNRFFPALYRLLSVHDKKIEECLSDVMLSSEARIDDDYVNKILEKRHSGQKSRENIQFWGSYALLGFTSILVVRIQNLDYPNHA